MNAFDVDAMKLAATTEPTLMVSEIFGPTFQGEGPNTGRQAVFLRLGGCNLNCSWCDTPYTWDWTGQNGIAYDRKDQLTSMTVEAVANNIAFKRGAARLLVVSGGEPPMPTHRAGLVALLRSPALTGIQLVQVETNGTYGPIEPDALPVSYVVSPKLSGSGVTTSRAIWLDSLVQLAEAGAAFKFVVTDMADVDEARTLVSEVGIGPSKVWLMPEGIRPDDLTIGAQDVWAAAINNGFNYSDRIHVRVWGDQRGI